MSKPPYSPNDPLFFLHRTVSEPFLKFATFGNSKLNRIQIGFGLNAMLTPPETLELTEEVAFKNSSIMTAILLLLHLNLLQTTRGLESNHTVADVMFTKDG